MSYEVQATAIISIGGNSQILKRQIFHIAIRLHHRELKKGPDQPGAGE